MIIILTYWQDGSGKPSITFFPQAGDQAEKVAVFIASQEQGIAFEIYVAEDLENEPYRAYPEEN